MLSATGTNYYQQLMPSLKSSGIAPKIAATRGPMAIASHLTGLTELLVATKLEKEKCKSLLENITELCIRWLKAQLERMEEPVGILVLDDVAGLLSPEDAKEFALPNLKRIFDSFSNKIHIFHNDTPNSKIYPDLAGLGIDVFNFSHEIPIEEARKLVGPDIVLMGNIAPVDLLVRGSAEQVRSATAELLDKLPENGPILVSAGGGVSPQTSIENLKAMLQTVKNFTG